MAPADTTVEALHLAAGGAEVEALLVRPPSARRLLLFGHGAGAGMHHAFMVAMSDALSRRSIATLRYQFPYMQRGQRRPDPQPVLLGTVRAAIELAAGVAGDLPLLAGGKSMGGRMTSLAIAQQPAPSVRGVIFFGFPLHPAGRPGTDRAAHLDELEQPMLLLQGTRDKLADLALIEQVVVRLGDRATLHVVPDADHGFHVPRRSGRTEEQVIHELAQAVEEWR